MYYYGVSKVSNNVSKRSRTPWRSPRHEVAFYLSESGAISHKRINKITFYFFKYFKKKWKRRKFICEECGDSFQGLIKNEGDKVDCPKCKSICLTN